MILLVRGWLLGKFYFSSISVLCSKTIQGRVLVEEGWMLHLYSSTAKHACCRGLFDLHVPSCHPWCRVPPTHPACVLCLAGPAALGSWLVSRGVTGWRGVAFLAKFPGLLKGWRGLEKLFSLQWVGGPIPCFAAKLMVAAWQILAGFGQHCEINTAHPQPSAVRQAGFHLQKVSTCLSLFPFLKKKKEKKKHAVF